MVLQGAFFLTFLVVSLITVRLWRLYSVHRFPGGGWWVSGCAGVALAAILSASSPFVGEWAKTLAAHVCLVGGFCALWIGTRQFLGGRENLVVIPLFVTFLLILAFVFYWFWVVDPMYQIRLTIDCLFLAFFSSAIAQALFAANIRSGIVTVAGVLYIVFAVINGFRTVNIILFATPESHFLSNVTSMGITVVMIPVLLAALFSFEYLVRNRAASSSENNE